MRKRLAAALLIAGPFLLAAPASAEPPFKFEYLPSEKCTLSKVEVEDVQLCLKMVRKFDSDCVKAGGTKTTDSGKQACRIPLQQAGAVKIPLTSTGPTFPGPAKGIKDKTIGDGSPGPYDAGSGAEAKTVDKGKIPKGCVLRPETCAASK